MITLEANDTIKSWAFLGIGTRVVVSYLNVNVFSRCCGRDPGRMGNIITYHTYVQNLFQLLSFPLSWLYPWMLPTAQLPPPGMYSARRARDRRHTGIMMWACRGTRTTVDTSA